jgi:hypothetical protein
MGRPVTTMVMSGFRAAAQLVARRPLLVLAWLGVLLVPAFLATLPFDLALGNALDLRPAATRLVTPPTHDAWWLMLWRQQSALPAAGVGSVLLTLLVSLPLAWIVSGFVTQAARGEAHAAAYVAARSVGVALVGLPLRVLVWAAAAMAGSPAVSALTPHAVLYPTLGALVIYAFGSSFIAVLGDYARAFAFAEPGGPLRNAWRRAFACARTRPHWTLCLTLFELALGALAFAPALLTRPLGLYSLATGALALIALVVRATGSVVGIAAATGAASRSA